MTWNNIPPYDEKYTITINDHANPYYENHAHCIICSTCSTKEVDNNFYICSKCSCTFTKIYIMYRKFCRRFNIPNIKFDRLDERLL